MPSTTPFLDLEDMLFAPDRGALARNARRFVLTMFAKGGRHRATTDRYRAVMVQPARTAA